MESASRISDLKKTYLPSLWMCELNFDEFKLDISNTRIVIILQLWVIWRPKFVYYIIYNMVFGYNCDIKMLILFNFILKLTIGNL